MAETEINRIRRTRNPALTLEEELRVAAIVGRPVESVRAYLAGRTRKQIHMAISSALVACGRLDLVRTYVSPWTKEAP